MRLIKKIMILTPQQVAWLEEYRKQGWSMSLKIRKLLDKAMKQEGHELEKPAKIQEPAMTKEEKEKYEQYADAYEVLKAHESELKEPYLSVVQAIDKELAEIEE